MKNTSMAEVKKIDRMVTAFLDEWTARTKHDHAVGDSLTELEQLTAGSGAGGSDEESVAGQLQKISEWLDHHGEAIAGHSVKRPELETLVRIAEHVVHMQGDDLTLTDGPESELRNRLVERLVELIRQGSKELGLEYTPAGLISTNSRSNAEATRARRSLLERLGGFDDIKEAFKKALEFQTERLAYFYQEDSHLLSVLDYQLKNLEARKNPEDEFFAACLLYFLHQHNYSIAPYTERFQKAVGTSDALDVWKAGP